jgi:O-antigen biosynthesis protein
VYGDEDKLGQHGQRHSPHFKPDFDPDRLLEQCYLGHLVVVRTDRVREVGGFRPGYEGSQDHDLWLRVTELVEPAAIVHVPWILYHWRETETSTAAAAEAKPYAATAGLAAVRDALRRRGVPAHAEPHPSVRNAYRVQWALAPPAPVVSIIVPTRDSAHLLRTCVRTLLERTAYDDFELLIVDNGSTDLDALAYLADLAHCDSRVRLLAYPHPFNFSAINNFAVQHARGEILALVNNDIEPIEPRWLRAMVAHAIRPDIGCVGAKLLYPDNRIQHAGVILGIGGVAGHSHKFLHQTADGYFGRPHLTHAVSAVTAACLVVKKSLFEAVGGMDAERLSVAFNDVDLCLKVRSLGKRNLYVPEAVLYHHESASRGADTDPRCVDRFRREVLAMKERWQIETSPDPYYSPNLTLEREDFGLRQPPP